MKKKTSYHHKNLKPELLELTARIIAEEGLDKVTLRELARRIGVSRTAPYRHFKDKNALLATVAERKFQGLNIALLSAFDEEAGPIAQLKRMALIYIDFALDNYDLYRLMFSEELKQGERYPGLAEAADETFAILAQTVQSCQEAGLVRQGNPTWLAYSAWSTLHGLAELLIEGKLVEIADRQAFFAFVCETMITGLGIRDQGT